MKQLRISVIVIIIIDILAVFAFAILFSGCSTQKQAQTKYNIVFSDSAKIERLSDSVRVLNIKNSEQAKVILNQNEKLKSLENSKVNEKITDFDNAGNIIKTQERTIDYSKTTESEKVFFLQYMYDKMSIENDSLHKTITENEQKWQHKVVDYQQQIKQKTTAKSLWYLWLIGGIVLGFVGNIYLGKYLKIFWTFIKKIF